MLIIKSFSTMLFWFDLVRIRSLQPNRTALRCHVRNEMSLSGPKWMPPGLPSLAVRGAIPGAMPGWWSSSPVTTTTAGGRLGDRHMPGERRPPGPANVGLTEDRGQVVWGIKESCDNTLDTLRSSYE